MIRLKLKIKSNDKIKIGLISSVMLYTFLLIIPFLVLPLAITEIPNNMNFIAFVYSIISGIISIFHYLRIYIKDLKEIKKYLPIFWSGIFIIFTYFFSINIQAIPLLFINTDLSKIPYIIKVIYSLIFEVAQIAFIIYLVKDKIKKDLKDLKKNHKEYFENNFKYYLMAIIIMMFSNLIISFINSGNIAGNEEAVREAFSKAPIYMYISAVFLAPLLEELVFRQGIRNIFSNDKLFIIMSGLVFGGLHVIGNVNSMIDLLYLIPYCVPGFAFAYMLYKTDNIFVPMGFHFLHNGVTMSLQVILLILGLL